MSKYNLFINSAAIAERIGQHYDKVRDELKLSVQHLSIQTHAKILEMANEDLKGWQRNDFLGEGGANIRWKQVSDNIWSVEIDEKVMKYSDGREPVSMATESWLLKNGKRAKDGSIFKVIPFTRDTSPKGTKLGNIQGTLNMLAKQSIQQARDARGQKIGLRTIEKNPDGTPKIGVLHKIHAEAPLTQKQAPDLFSRPRTKEQAAKSGLKPHDGIYKLQGLAVSQTMQGGKVKRDAVNFRVVSSKHQAEGDRWIYPEIKAHNFLKRAFDWAVDEAWPQQLRELTERLKKS